jgi:hypothetical protein
MTDKPPTTDPEQRAHDTRVSRYQSGLPPESEAHAREQPPQRTEDASTKGASSDKEEKQQQGG